MPADRRLEVLRVAQRRHDLVPAVREQPREPLAQQHLVLGDHDPHGSSAIRRVPWAGSLSIRSRPP